MADEESFKNAFETIDSIKTCNVGHTRITPPLILHLFVTPVQWNAQILFCTQHVNNLFYSFVVQVMQRVFLTILWFFLVGIIDQNQI